MNDAEFRIQKRRIQRLLQHWRAPLGLTWWRIDLDLSREPLALPRDGSGDGGGSWVTMARADPRWEYGKAVLHFNLPELAEIDDGALENIFVHECCHILVNEMRMWGAEEMSAEKLDEAIKHEERVVSALTNAFLWTRQKGFREGARPARQPATEPESVPS